MEKMKRRTQQSTSSLLGRIGAGFMAILLVIGTLVGYGCESVSAANVTYTDITDAMTKINNRMKGHYVAQMYRSRKRVEKIPSGQEKYYTTIKEGWYYRNSEAGIADKGGGICTWCSFINLLNRRLAAECSTDGEFDATKLFTVEEVFKVVCGMKNNSDFYFRMYEDEKRTLGKQNFIYISGYDGNTDDFSDTYTNGSGYSITTQEFSFSASLTAEEKMEKVRKLLDEHPEGVQVYYKRDDNNKHGVVMIGYYYDEYNDPKFQVLDPVSFAGDEKNNWALETSWVGKQYQNGGVAREVFDHLISYIVVTDSRTGEVACGKTPSDGEPNNNSGNTDVAPLVIKDLSIDGEKTSVMLDYKKSANLCGTVTSGATIKEIRAVVSSKDGSVNKTYGPISPSDQETYNPNSVNLAKSALNKTVNDKKIYIAFGDFAPGSYTLKVSATDYAGCHAEESLEFTVNGAGTVPGMAANEIKIDLSQFTSNLPYNKSYNIPGLITAGSEILKVQGTIYNVLNPLSPAKYRDGFRKSGKLDCTETQSSYIARNKLNSSLMANKTTFNIINSNINSSFAMAGLAKGFYTFKVKVTLVNGTTKTASVLFYIL